MTMTDPIQNAPVYKITVLGDPGVGKTAILYQFTQNQFHETIDPTISEIFTKLSQFDGEYARMTLQDTAGQDAFKAMREQYTRNANGFLIVYSITDQKSLDNVEKYYVSIKQIKNVDSFPCVMLVANKQDLSSERSVSETCENDLCQRLDLPKIDSSAKTKLNIEEAFHRVVSQI
ncbi:hypothetical protein Ciccas_003884, partial [Cichlidogyrus casuarinus]